MTYSVRNPPAKSKYTLQICYGGHFETESDPTYQNYQNYTGEGVIWVENLDYLRRACLRVVNDLAHKLGYRNTPEIYIWHKGRQLKITSHDDVTETISQLGANRELIMYIVGDREEEALEQNPTILSWNCRGLNKSTIAMLRVLILIYDPTIIFLIETRLSSSKIGKISYSLGFQNFRACPANRNVADLKDFNATTNEEEYEDDPDNCVGLAVLWKTNLKLELSNISNNYLDFVVKIPDNDKNWRFIAFYGHPKDKRLSWEWLQELSKESPKSVRLVVGDFNEILDPEEKDGGRVKNKADISRFKNCLITCGLEDLSFEGNKFTWRGNGGVKERLDRGVASPTWIDSFPHCKVLHLIDQTISDHIPILVETNSQKPKPLKTETLMGAMVNLLSFASDVETLYHTTDLTTVSHVRSQMRGPTSPDFYFDITQNVGPHIFQVKYIAVHDEDKKIVTYERLVTLTARRNLSQLLLNCMAIPKPSREYCDLAIPEEFPSLSCQKKNVLNNLSEYLMQTWKLIELIPKNRKIPRQEIVEQKIYEQVENLIRWYTEVKRTNDIGGGYSNILKKLEENASMIGRAVIVCNTMISLFRGGMIKPQGTTTELNASINPEYLLYFPQNDCSRHCEETIEFLLDTLGWRHPENVFEYDISHITEDQLSQGLNNLEERMFKTNRDIMLLTQRLRPWIKLIIDNDSEKEKLARFVDTRTIKCQIELLQHIGCISISKNDEVALEADRNSEPIINRLKKAADEAFKTLKNKSTKSMTSSAYMYKLKEAYDLSGKVAKRKKM